VKIVELFRKKALDNRNERSVTIAFLGDSVTQGCFETDEMQGGYWTVFDDAYSYGNCLCKMLSKVFPSVPVNMIKAGVSGDSAPRGLARLDRDVLRYHPDLVVVCYGLNDVSAGIEGIPAYTDALKNIFERIKETGSEIIFMTPNMLATYVCEAVHLGVAREFTEKMCELQNTGVMDLYMESARTVCKTYGITLCDCYKKWKVLEAAGADTTRLLANYINHPTREMSWMFAYALFETIMEMD